MNKIIITDKSIKDFTKIIYKKFGNNKYSEIIKIISDLGEDADKPDLILTLLDIMPSLISYVSLLLNVSKNELDMLNTIYDNWKSSIESTIKINLFNENIDNGMTAGQSKPTEKDVVNYFNKYYKNSLIGKKWMKKINKARKRYESLKVMSKFTETKFESLRSIRGLLDTMITSGLLKPEIGTGKKLSLFRIGKSL